MEPLDPSIFTDLSLIIAYDFEEDQADLARAYFEKLKTQFPEPQYRVRLIEYELEVRKLKEWHGTREELRTRIDEVLRLPAFGVRVRVVGTAGGLYC